MSDIQDNFYGRLDYRLMQNGPINLYQSSEVLAKDIENLNALNYKIDEFDCSAWNTTAQMHEQIATVLRFPDYYGKNLDALNDCLSELKISENRGRVLVFRRFDLFAAKEPKTSWHLLDIIANISRANLRFNARLFTLVQSDDPEIRFDNLGANSAVWKKL